MKESESSFGKRPWRKTKTKSLLEKDLGEKPKLNLFWKKTLEKNERT